MKPQPRYNKGDRIGDRYLVHQALMGGMGEVYLCLDEEEMYPYALKTFQQRYLTQTQTQTLRRAFEQEVLAWVGLEKHPNIVRCFRMDILDSQPFMLLEWIAGEEGKGADLRGWLRQGPLELKITLDFAIEICRALVHAQQKQPGIVHRDLKPENILVAQGRQVKITDFGLAQIVVQANLGIEGWASPEDIVMTSLQQSLVASSGIAGTPPYMPPEQWQPGAVLDERTDIYALGCILYEMLTGQPPFVVDISPTMRENYRSWLRAWQSQHENVNRPYLHSIFPHSVGNLVATCLARDREARPKNASTLLMDVIQVYEHLFGEKPEASPPPEKFSSRDYGNRGNTYYRLGHYDLALADYAEASKLSPIDPLIFTNRGAVYEKLQRFADGIEEHNQAIRLDSNIPQVHYNRGNVFQKLGRFEEALVDYSSAIRLNGEFVEAYYNRGNVYTQLRDHKKALTDYTRAIELDDSFSQAYVNRGLAYSNLGFFAEALADYDQAVRLDSTSIEAFCNRGNSLNSLMRFDEAVIDFSRAISIDPSYAPAYSGRGASYQNLQNYQQALLDHNQAIHFEPFSATSYLNRGNMYARLKKYDQALADYDHAIELDSEQALSHFNRGLLYEETQSLGMALDDYTEAIRLDPNYTPSYHNRGNVLAELKRYDEAISDYTRAIQLNPRYPSAHYNRGIIYRKLKRDNDAVQDYAITIGLDPDFAPAYLNIGAILAKHGSLRDALPYFEKAAELGLSEGREYLVAAKRKIEEEIT